MKRILVVVGLVATLAFASIALGAVKHYRGPVEQGGHVTFDTKVRHHKTKKVKDFVFSKVSMTCDPPTGTINITNKAFPVPAMRVHHRKFHGNFTKFGATGHITGEFKHHFRKAKGTLRVNGNPAGLQNCDTGTDDWTAEKR